MAESASAAPLSPVEPLSESSVRRSLIRRGWWFSLLKSSVSSTALAFGGQRLDADFHTAQAASVTSILASVPVPVKNLGDLCDVYTLDRFKRVYTSDAAKGWPYLSASEAFLFRPHSERWIAKSHAPPDAERHFVKRKWVLLSTSGSVGRVLYATSNLEGFFLTHDLARILSRGEVRPGYLFAYLSGALCQPMLRPYGLTVRHIEPEHLKRILVPVLPDDDQRAIENEVERAREFRERANTLIDQAGRSLLDELGLPSWSSTRAGHIFLPPARYGPINYPDPSAFQVRLSEVIGPLTADSNDPVIRETLARLAKGKYELVQLGSLTAQPFIPNRSARVYVDQDHGAPFLQASDVPTVRPYSLRYVSKKVTKLLTEWTVHKGWVLVTRSGTVGEIGLVSTAEDSWAVSEHVIRIPPTEPGFHPGYLAAFLMSPYGRNQLVFYGAVVKSLLPETVASVLVPKAPRSVQQKIGDAMVEAFELKSRALNIEDDAIQLTVQLIRNLPKRQATSA